MSKCNYCGRERQNDVEPCQGCGTAVHLDIETPVSPWGMLDFALGMIAIASGNFSGIIHLVKGLSEVRPTVDKNSPRFLLERAAAMEGWNRRKAVALYHEIVPNHPGTPAAREAARNIRALRAAQDRRSVVDAPTF